MACLCLCKSARYWESERLREKKSEREREREREEIASHKSMSIRLRGWNDVPLKRFLKREREVTSEANFTLSCHSLPKRVLSDLSWERWWKKSEWLRICETIAENWISIEIDSNSEKKSALQLIISQVREWIETLVSTNYSNCADAILANHYTGSRIKLVHKK